MVRAMGRMARPLELRAQPRRHSNDSSSASSSPKQASRQRSGRCRAHGAHNHRRPLGRQRSALMARSRTGTAVPPVSLRTALYATSSTSSPRAASYRYVADVHRLGLVLQLGQGKAVELRVGKVREWTCCWTVNKIVLTAPENIPWYQFVVCSVHSDSCSCPGC